MINKRHTCNFIKYLLSIADECHIKSITASGYNPSSNDGISFDKVDYSQYDICITNPPFSLYTKFIKNIVSEHNNRIGSNTPFDFIVLSSTQNRVNPNVGLCLMKRECFLGYDIGEILNFIEPEGTATAGHKIFCDWITTFDNAQKERDTVENDIISNISYYEYKDEYPVIESIIMKDGSHPIEINNTRIIPYDYDGWMYCSLSILNNLSFEKWDWYGSTFQRYYNKENPSHSPFRGKIDIETFKLNGKTLFGGILIKKKKS